MKNTTQQLLSELHGREKKRVLFVCLGNICRSPAAEGIMREIVRAEGEADKWVIDSAGIGGWHVGQQPDRRMCVHAGRRGIDLTGQRCRQVRPSDFDDFDIVIGMDSSYISDLCDLARTPDDERKIVSMGEFVSMATRYDHIPDPYYEGAEGFELVLDLLGDACRNLFDRCR